jgi:hypothetical protein
VAAWAELTIEQGASFNNIIYITDDITNANINLASYIVRSQIRRHSEAVNATANIVCTITDNANGIIAMTMSAANTALIKKGRYYFDVEMEGGGIVTRILQGIVIVDPQITK